MINNFKKIFGDTNKVLVCIGDYDEKHCLKFNEPTKGKSIRKLFKNAGYNLFIVNEYNTTKINHFTGEVTEKFRMIQNPRPRKDNEYLRHGLLRSKNVNKNKSMAEYMLLNRDLNGSMNIRQKALCIIKNEKMPKHLKHKLPL